MAVTSNTQSPRKLVVFSVGPGSFAIDVAAISEILPADAIVPVRGAPGGVIGMTNIRGRVVPVFDLHWKFDVPQPIDWDSQRLLLVEMHDGPVALMVDAVDEVATVAADGFQGLETPGSRRRLGYIQGVLHIGTRVVLWVDPALLLPAGLGDAIQRAA